MYYKLKSITPKATLASSKYKHDLKGIWMMVKKILGNVKDVFKTTP